MMGVRERKKVVLLKKQGGGWPEDAIYQVLCVCCLANIFKATKQ